MARVVVISGADKGVEYKFDREAILGRHSGNTIPVADRRTSRQHSRIFYRENAYYIEDMSSRNGTMVNGNPIMELQLKPGDRITIGDTNLLFFVSDTTPRIEEICDSCQTPQEKEPQRTTGNRPRRAKILLFAKARNIPRLRFSRFFAALFILGFMVGITLLSRWLTLWLLG